MNYILYIGFLFIVCILYLWLISVIFFDRFDIVGYGCMICIGNSGFLLEFVLEVIEKVNIISIIVDLCLFFV